MSDISEWSTKEQENTHIDELTLSGESGQYINKIMCAVKAKINDIDSEIDGSIDSNIVHKTGEENIAGEKTLSDDLKIAKSNPVLRFQLTDVTKGTPPAQDKRATPCLVCDGGGIEDKNRLGMIDVVVRSNSATETRLIANKFEADNASTAAVLTLTCLDNGTARLTVPFTRPQSDGNLSLGHASAKWSEVFASTGTINTSDERQKEEISDFSEDVLDAWEGVGFSQFKFSSSVAEKGANARFHCGLIAQQIIRAFELKGIDATKYGFVCYDSWPGDENTEPGDSYGVRYVEALCLEAACLRRKIERLETRIKDLEEK